MNEAKLNYREYNGLRALGGVLSAWAYITEGLNKRCMEMGWEYAERLTRVQSDVQALFDGIVRTVPRNRLMGLKQELMHTKLDIRTDYVGAEHLTDNWICVKESAFVQIAKLAQGVECSMCMKRGREVKSCKLRQLLNDTLPYKTPAPADPTTCVYAEQLIETLEGKSVEQMMEEVRG